ncbi:right-handed parallel beta-helix repeat-containing protein, partial [Planctomycetota bacterium]
GNGDDLDNCFANYSCIEDGDGGLGNFSTDPRFADPDNGDYHLESTAGRHDPATSSWVVDDVDSPCIDMGDPSQPVGDEPTPNGGRLNMGAYGGTAEASKTALPIITAVAPHGGPPGSQGIVTGHSFHTAVGTLKFTSSGGAEMSWEVLSWTNTQIAFRVPEGTPLGTGQLRIVRSNGVEGSGATFEVTDPGTICVNFDNASGIENGSWEHPFDTVGEGLAAATSGDQVWVAEGVYTALIELEADVALYGGFCGTETELSQRNWTTHVTILDGGGSGDIVTAPPGATAATRIDGFTIRDGYRGVHCASSSPTIANNTIIGHSSNGVACYNGSSPTVAGNTITTNDSHGIYCNASSPNIANNTITANRAKDGAGIYCYHDSSPEIVNNEISGNAASDGGGGIACRYSAHPTITGNTIHGNSAYQGAGIYCNDYSSPVVSSNTITGNVASRYGGGIRCTGRSAPYIADNTISGNSAWDGAGIECYDHSSPTIVRNTISGNHASDGGGGVCLRGDCDSWTMNNTISENSAYQGGGIFCPSSSPTILYNTVVGNAAPYGGGIRAYGSSPAITSCILWGNGDDLDNCFANYSCIEDGDGGLGNFSTDPRFADPDNGDYHLKSTAGRYDPATASWVVDDVHSPCIDRGDPARHVGAEPVPNGGRINMGRYARSAEASLSIRPRSLIQMDWVV